jgi:hypothetical protein
MIKARLAMLFEAGSNEAVPCRTVVRLSRMIEFKKTWIKGRKLQFVRDFFE